MGPVTLRKRTSRLVRALPPTAPPVRQIPMAILRASIFGLVVGPLLGPFFAWSDSFRAAHIGGTYSVVFYMLCALPVGYIREYFVQKSSTRAKAAVVVTNLVGVAAASLFMFELFEGYRGRPSASVWDIVPPHELRLVDVQIPIVLSMFALGWGYVVSERQFADAERSLATSRAYTRALQSRMNPHFFFNTLNTIAALIPDDQEAAQRMLGLMADMSRYVFTGADSEVASLRAELEFARGYLEIEGVRFGGRLRCTLPSDSETEDIVGTYFHIAAVDRKRRAIWHRQARRWRCHRRWARADWNALRPNHRK
jgi:hypothetical protein